MREYNFKRSLRFLKCTRLASLDIFVVLFIPVNVCFVYLVTGSINSNALPLSHWLSIRWSNALHKNSNCITCHTTPYKNLQGRKIENPDSKVHWANIGPTWVLSAPDGPHVGSMNLAINEVIVCSHTNSFSQDGADMLNEFVTFWISKGNFSRW